MADTYNQAETEKGEMKVILEFPQKSEREEFIKLEVKEILSGALNEQLEKGRAM